MSYEIDLSSSKKASYSYWRIRIFYSIYLGYGLFYLTRKSFTFVMPAMVESLGFSKVDLGYLASLLYLAYGLSKFLSGVISDKTNPRYFMAVGLVLTGFCNIFFGFSSTMFAFALFWLMNGWFQGWGWPPCARLLVHWYGQKERGRWWGFWNTSQNVSGALVPFVVTLITTFFGWRFGMIIPGVISFFGGVFLINRLRDSPESLGLSPVDHQKRESDSGSFIESVVKNKYIWMLGFAYFFLYVVRTALHDWGQLYLYEYKGLNLSYATLSITSFELGGILGGILAGVISDKIFSGKRGDTNILFTLLYSFTLGLFFFTSTGISVLMFSFFFGLFIFGPQMLIGVAAAELANKRLAGTATGFVGFFAYIGAACSGLPIGLLIEKYGWASFSLVIMLSCFCSALSLILLWSSQKNLVSKLASNK